MVIEPESHHELTSGEQGKTQMDEVLKELKLKTNSETLQSNALFNFAMIQHFSSKRHDPFGMRYIEVLKNPSLDNAFKDELINNVAFIPLMVDFVMSTIHFARTHPDFKELLNEDSSKEEATISPP